MTDWRAAGQLADAHRITNQLRSFYATPTKARIRNAAVRWLQSQKVGLVADLWGGGASAEAMVKAGLAARSIDDGRQGQDMGFSRGRVQRALMTAAMEAGYEARFGAAHNNMTDCDGAWLDFCGHWSPEMSRTLRSCRGMKAVVLTVMPERTPLGRLDTEEWVLALVSLAEAASGLGVAQVRRYKRASDLPAFVLFMLQTKPPCVWCGRPVVYRSSTHCGHELCKRKTWTQWTRIKRKTDPVYAAKHKEANRRAYQLDRERRLALYHERYWSDPEFREEQKARNRAYSRQRAQKQVLQPAA